MSPLITMPTDSKRRVTGFSRLAVVATIALTLGLVFLTRTTSTSSVANVVPVGPLPVDMYAAVAGKYSFASSNGYEDFLKAKGLGMVKRSLLAKEKPDLIIENYASGYTLTTVYSLKTTKISFALGVPFDADFNYNFVEHVVATLHDDTLDLARTDDASRESYAFGADGIVVTYTANDGTSGTVTYRLCTTRLKKLCAKTVAPLDLHQLTEKNDHQVSLEDLRDLKQVEEAALTAKVLQLQMV
ncbi:hypothetical protein DYB25_009786 [Aphanomyces astaci]|uniref:Cytosolic fatty-acid binding proteins domain-containing protein n=2 Tax=Aphanomyces astaci TaxID=112090 RepID=A0A396ZNF8_APHAT|nr:hypothetical protein DYB25_009786 [Aphanomyces astaci]